MSFDVDHSWFEYGLDRRKRVIYYGSVHSTQDLEEGGVDYASVGKLVKGLHLLESSSNSPITIYINNPGGDEYHMFAAYDAIRRCKSQVTAIGMGYVMSAASIIMQAADVRVMLPNAWMMIHYGTWFSEDHALNFLKSAKHSEALNAQMENIYLLRIREVKPRYSRGQLQADMRFDLFLNAKEAVGLGLADEVES